MQVRLVQACRRFITYLTVQKRLSLHTVSAYARDCQVFVAYCSTQGIVDISSCERVEFTRYLMFLKRERNLHNRSIARHVAAMRCFMRFLHDNYTTAIIPFAQLSSPRQGFSIPKVLSYTQLEQLFACLDNKERLPKDIRDTMVLLLLFVTGMRVSELVSLNLDAIDWHERIIRVFGKGAKERLIPVPQEFVDKLYYYVTSVRPVLLKYMSHNNCQSLFNLSRQGIWYILKSRGKKVGITLYPHLLRHSFATHFLANGADLRSLQTLLGHRNLTTTQIYTHVDKHQLRQVYNNAHLRK